MTMQLLCMWLRVSVPLVPLTASNYCTNNVVQKTLQQSTHSATVDMRSCKARWRVKPTPLTGLCRQVAVIYTKPNFLIPVMTCWHAGSLLLQPEYTVEVVVA